jgi:hypothetical protein
LNKYLLYTRPTTHFSLIITLTFHYIR